MAEVKFPSEIIELPSRGVLYPADSSLHTGKVEMRYMSAKDEDILTNQSYIEKGIVIDKLLQSLLVDKNIDYSQLLAGDKNALLIAARVLGYGSSYEFDYNGEKVTIDLSSLPDKPLHKVVAKAKENNFEFELPVSKNKVTFKLMTHADEVAIDQELRALKKINKGESELSTRLKYIITSVNGDSERKTVREFVDSQMLAADARALRKYVAEIQPDVDMRFYPDDKSEGVQIPIGVNFLWPDIG